MKHPKFSGLLELSSYIETEAQKMVDGATKKK